MVATGGLTPYTWSATGFPNGMSINSSTGAPFGTPTVSGTFNVTITVRDSSSPQLTASKVLTLTVIPAAPNISGISPNPVPGSNVAQPLTIYGGNFICTPTPNVTLRDVTNNQTFANRAISSCTSSQIVINPNFTNTTANWSVQVINSNGLASTVFGFSVIRQ